MSNNTCLLSTAYFPTVDYISVFKNAESVLIEKEENYIKQTYRNRCRIYSANGPLMLTVPVKEGSFHKRAIKDIKIDYSKRWQQIHLGALAASYRSAPFFEYYYSSIENVITGNHIFLLDLNMHSLDTMLKASGITTSYQYTSGFNKPGDNDCDLRYNITSKKKSEEFLCGFTKYSQVFDDRYGFIPGLSIIDLIFNTGPDTPEYLGEQDIPEQVRI